MSFRKMIFVLAITVSVIFIGVIGGSYAYYNASESLEVNVNSVDAHPVTVIFNDSEHINTYTGIPITSLEVSSKASHNSFSIIVDEDYFDDYEIAIRMGMTNVSIDSDLMVNDFKYKLNCTVTYDDSTSEDIDLASGTGEDFEELGENDFILYTEEISNEVNYDCGLYVWLEENNQNQNELMNKHFEATMKVDTVMRKKDSTNE